MLNIKERLQELVDTAESEIEKYGSTGHMTNTAIYSLYTDIQIYLSDIKTAIDDGVNHTLYELLTNEDINADLHTIHAVSELIVHIKSNLNLLESNLL